ncbi:uncharacterized protein LOC109204700 [Tachysurus ichikawai]
MDLRQLHEELGAELPHLTWDQLKELAEFAKVSVDKVRKKHIIVHLINEEIDVVIEKEDKDAASQFIGDVLEVIKQMKKKPGTLTGRAVNQTDIPFSGWIEVKFQLDTSDTSNKGPLVPLLVSKTPGVAEEPIIGEIPALVREQLEEADKEQEYHLSPEWPEGLTVTENVVRLQRGTWSKALIPVCNDTCHDITLPPRTVLGHVQSVKAVYPAAAKPVEIEDSEDHSMKSPAVENPVTTKE